MTSRIAETSAAAASHSSHAQCARSSSVHRRATNSPIAAIRRAAEMDDSELPARSPRGDGPPLPRAWAEKDPVAARRLTIARDAMAARATELEVPVENLLTPDYLRRTLWTPPATRDPERLGAAVADQLAGYGARPWQVEIAGPILTDAILAGDVEPVAGAEGDGEG